MIIRIAVMILLCGVVFAESGAELYLYGKSYHSNREYGFNETNPGLGLGFYSRKDTDSKLYMTGQASVYYDSYENFAKTITLGPRYVLGDVNAWHIDASIQFGGVKTGIDNKKVYAVVLPSVSVGYDRYNMHLVYIPETGNDIDSSHVVAAFLRIGLN